MDEVWLLNETTASIFEINSSGIIQFPAFRECALARNVVIRPIRFNSSYREPGVPYERTRSRVIGWTIQIGELHRKKSTEITPFTNNDGKKWRILFQFVNPENGQNQERDFRYAELLEGPETRMADNQPTDMDMTFQAEWEA